MKFEININNKTIQLSEVEDIKVAMLWIEDNIKDANSYKISIKPIVIEKLVYTPALNLLPQPQPYRNPFPFGPEITF